MQINQAGTGVSIAAGHAGWGLLLILVASFRLSGGSFLAFAALADKRGLATTARGRKGFFHAGGLAEGTETIAAFLLMCLFPGSFALIAWIFAAACLITACGRCLDAACMFRDGS